MDFELWQGGVHLIQVGPLNLETLGHVSSSLWMAQTFNQDLGSTLSQSWQNFIQSGQVWALMIGFVVGYIFRSITSY